MHYGWIALLVLALVFMTPLSRVLLAVVFGRAIGKAALARQPDTIRLEPMDPSALRNGTRVRNVAADLERAGFESAGVFSVAEMPGMCVQLLAHRGESMAAAIYDHPVAGMFYDVVSRYQDGTSCTHSTARPTGLKSPPGKRIVHAPGAEPAQLLEQARRERPREGLRSCDVSSVAGEFVAAYAETMAWMKQRGVSTAEVVQVARRKAA